MYIAFFIVSILTVIGCLIVFKYLEKGSRHKDSSEFDINSLNLGALARKALNQLSANSLEIIVNHFREETQLFSWYYSIDNLQKASEYREKLVFKLNAEYDTVLEVCSDFPVDKGQLNQLATQFAYVLSTVIFTAAQSRFVELAEQSLKAKTGFLANLSHEVRAPLGVILNATELVLDGLCGEINENQKKFLSLSKKSSDHLLDLINDVLDYAKIEAGKVNPQPKQISVADTLKDILNMARLLAEPKHIEVMNEETDTSLSVSADKKHFRQILINLTTNAIKYTQDHGSVKIWAEKYGNDYVRISVQDSGVGIAEDQKHKVFKPFERLDEEYSRQQGGVGIGLSLARKLAELNGGSLDFESAAGKGTTFFLTVPLADENAVPQNAAEGKDSVKAQGESIAVIDPDSSELEIVSTYFKDLGYQIIAFGSLQEAENGIKDSDCSLLILDNTIFDEHEKTASEFLKGLDQKREIPLILLSSRAFVFDLEKYLKLGVERCLPKPAPLKELAMLCREILDRQDT